MASKTKRAPNDLSHREKTRKAGKCQWCEKKVPLEEQKAVFNDLDEGKVVVVKATSRRGQGKGHWCDECAAKRKSMSQRWLDRRDGKPAPARKAKASGTKKATAKAAKKPAKRTVSKPKRATAKAKAAPKRRVRKPGKGKAASAAEPF